MTVEDLSRKAFDCLPDVSSAIRELSKLKAVGPATASGQWNEFADVQFVIIFGSP